MNRKRIRSLVKRSATSIVIGFAIVVALFFSAVTIIWVTNYDLTIAYYAQLPLRLPYVIDRMFIPMSFSHNFLRGRTSATIFVYGLNTLIFALPVFIVLSYLERGRQEPIKQTTPPPPPKF